MATVGAMRKLLLLAALICLAAALRAPHNDLRKKLQGPPEEFSDFALPNPVLAAQRSDSAWLYLSFVHNEDGATSSWKGSVHVDSDEQFSLSLFTPHKTVDVVVQPPEQEAFSLVINPPSAILIDSKLSASTPFVKREGPFGIDGASVPVTTYTFDNPVTGTWQVEIKVATQVPTGTTQAILMTTNKSPYRLFSHVTTFDLQLDQEVGLSANLYHIDSLFREGRPDAILTEVEAQMEITFPTGKRVYLPMHDDGSHTDRLQNDGVYGATLEAVEPGQYVAQAIFKGTTPEGKPFLRTTQHIFNVLSPYAVLTGLADAEYSAKDKTMYFQVDVDLLAEAIGDDKEITLKAYAELWGTDSSGYQFVPVAWMQAMTDVKQTTKGEHALTLQVHEDWIHKAQANPPFQLRNVWIQDRDANVLLSERKAIYVDLKKTGSLFKLDTSRRVIEITEEMRVGPRPLKFSNRTRSTAEEGKIVLVHGYCAGANEFPLTDFTNAVHFQDYKKKRSNDEFALLIQEFANDIPSFSLVAHSQGGMAILHLHTYYWSGLENAANGRLLQSVGTPYLGCGLAGGLADIGGLFGFACGSNYDLTFEGAALWEKAIPAENKKDVYFYTTQYSQDSYCVWGASLVLYSPNDGTTEFVKAKLPNANDAGHKEGWCHTTGMKYDAQCRDRDRNLEMNKLAAR